MRGDGEGVGHAANGRASAKVRQTVRGLRAYLTSFMVSVSSLMLAIRLLVNAASVRNDTFLRPLQLQKDSNVVGGLCFVANDLGRCYKIICPT